MSVYVDELDKRGQWKFGMSCHLFPDIKDVEKGDLSEFHKFAMSIGLKPEWFQPVSWPHYDLNSTKRILAVRAGAIECTSREYIKDTMEYRKKLFADGINIKEYFTKLKL